MKVALLGHWDRKTSPSLGFSPPVSTLEAQTVDPLERIRDGLLAERPDAEVQIIPFGAGPTFSMAVPDGLAVRGERSWGDATGNPLVIEVGHEPHHDWGRAALRTVLRATQGSAPEKWEDILECVSQLVNERHVTVACSTERPLDTPGGTRWLNPGLRVRSEVTPFPGGDTVAFGTLPGSGAGSGAAAVLASLGARLQPTGELLMERQPVASALATSDLLVVATPYWHAPDLVDVAVRQAVVEAGASCIPTVGVGAASSLSPQESADFGVDGIHLLSPKAGWEALGRRVARTWLPRVSPSAE